MLLGAAMHSTVQFRPCHSLHTPPIHPTVPVGQCSPTLQRCGPTTHCLRLQEELRADAVPATLQRRWVFPPCKAGSSQLLRQRGLRTSAALSAPPRAA